MPQYLGLVSLLVRDYDEAIAFYVGDRIRILRVPEGDLRRRVQDIETGSALPGITADSIERIIHQTPVVPICRVDEDGCVRSRRYSMWFKLSSFFGRMVGRLIASQLPAHVVANV